MNDRRLRSLEPTSCNFTSSQLASTQRSSYRFTFVLGPRRSQLLDSHSFCDRYGLPASQTLLTCHGHQATMPSPLISPPPSLLPDLPPEERTNTAALLLPHQALFAPPILDILRAHYESFGPIAHWAPIRAFGRVIIVWQEVEGCEWAKREGDFLKLDVDLPPLDDKVQQGQGQAQAERVGTEGYFGSKRNRPGHKG